MLLSAASFATILALSPEEQLARFKAQFESTKQAIEAKNAAWSHQVESFSQLNSKLETLKTEAIKAKALAARRAVSAGAAATGKMAGKLRAKVVTLTASKQELETTKTKLEEEKAKLEREKATLVTSEASLKENQAQIEAKNHELKANKRALDEQQLKLAETNRTLEAKVAELEERLKQKEQRAHREEAAGPAPSHEAPHEEAAAAAPVVHHAISSLEGDDKYKLAVFYLKKDEDARILEIAVPHTRKLTKLRPRIMEIEKLQVSFRNLKRLDIGKRTKSFFPSLPAVLFTENQLSDKTITTHLRTVQDAYLAGKEAERKITEDGSAAAAVPAARSSRPSMDEDVSSITKISGQLDTALNDQLVIIRRILELPSHPTAENLRDRLTALNMRRSGFYAHDFTELERMAQKFETWGMRLSRQKTEHFKPRTAKVIEIMQADLSKNQPKAESIPHMKHEALTDLTKLLETYEEFFRTTMARKFKAGSMSIDLLDSESKATLTSALRPLQVELLKVKTHLSTRTETVKKAKREFDATLPEAPTDSITADNVEARLTEFKTRLESATRSYKKAMEALRILATALWRKPESGDAHFEVVEEVEYHPLAVKFADRLKADFETNSPSDEIMRTLGTEARVKAIELMKEYETVAKYSAEREKFKGHDDKDHPMFDGYAKNTLETLERNAKTLQTSITNAPQTSITNAPHALAREHVESNPLSASHAAAAEPSHEAAAEAAGPEAPSRAAQETKEELDRLAKTMGEALTDLNTQHIDERLFTTYSNFLNFLIQATPALTEAEIAERVALLTASINKEVKIVRDEAKTVENIKGGVFGRGKAERQQKGATIVRNLVTKLDTFVKEHLETIRIGKLKANRKNSEKFKKLIDELTTLEILLRRIVAHDLPEIFTTLISQVPGATPSSSHGAAAAAAASSGDVELSSGPTKHGPPIPTTTEKYLMKQIEK
jgi:hypothetical protein